MLTTLRKPIRKVRHLLVISEQEFPEGIEPPHPLSFVMSLGKFCLRELRFFSPPGERERSARFPRILCKESDCSLHY